MNSTQKEMLMGMRCDSAHGTVGIPDIARTVSEQTSISWHTVDVVATRLFEEIQRQLLAGNQIMVKNFGKFGFSSSKPKLTNDVTRDDTLVYTPARSTLKFTPCSALRWKVFFSSCILPDELPDGVSLSQRMLKDPDVRKRIGIEDYRPAPPSRHIRNLRPINRSKAN